MRIMVIFIVFCFWVSCIPKKQKGALETEEMKLPVLDIKGKIRRVLFELYRRMKK